MFRKIMVPVDLRHTESMQKALGVAADLSRHYSASVCYVGVTGSEPSELAHRPEEFAEKLKRFAEGEAKERGHTATSHMVISHDPTTELDDALSRALAETGADLVVMATHLPNVTDYIWASHGGTLAMHSNASVMLVRG